METSWRWAPGAARDPGRAGAAGPVLACWKEPPPSFPGATRGAPPGGPSPAPPPGAASFHPPGRLLGEFLGCAFSACFHGGQRGPGGPFVQHRPLPRRASRDTDKMAPPPAAAARRPRPGPHSPPSARARSLLSALPGEAPAAGPRGAAPPPAAPAPTRAWGQRGEETFLAAAAAALPRGARTQTQRGTPPRHSLGSAAPTSPPIGLPPCPSRRDSPPSQPSARGIGSRPCCSLHQLAATPAYHLGPTSQQP